SHIVVNGISGEPAGVRTVELLIESKPVLQCFQKVRLDDRSVSVQNQSKTERFPTFSLRTLHS
ncbi:MAG: hypothetical protein AAF202_10850, partial [Pseudomonadota bacterium]